MNELEKHITLKGTNEGYYLLINVVNIHITRVTTTKEPSDYQSDGCGDSTHIFK